MVAARDAVPERAPPLVVGGLLAVNVIVFGYELWLGAAADGSLEELVSRWGLVPREFLRGVAEPEGTGRGVWLTPLTSMFLHGGLLHLLGNALYLWVFGRRVESVLGHTRFALLYLACGIAAAAVHVASAPSSYLVTLGASGAVSGVLGATLVSEPAARLRLLWAHRRVPALLFVALWVVIQVMLGFWSSAEELAGVAWWAHVGGFAAGLALGRWLRPSPARARARS